MPAAKLTVYLPKTLRDEARAAYRATNHLEGERSWSEFIARAVEAEVHRRRIAHNHGHPFEPDTTPLAAGRPLAD